MDGVTGAVEYPLDHWFVGTEVCMVGLGLNAGIGCTVVWAALGLGALGWVWVVWPVPALKFKELFALWGLFLFVCFISSNRESHSATIICSFSDHLAKIIYYKEPQGKESLNDRSIYQCNVDTSVVKYLA
uniref:Uncharacterized protein n=1 Tax=Eutreptiella gymnastica TaxID=73025 RepID=A0A7S1IE85_9EUGL|mmetsp:Transcript_149577/g.261420  ORF Transcript_149577/g.261420 Transcript_149577/m.261420 type:complete len:130 (+) Transcript_149577:256-645(+)